MPTPRLRIFAGPNGSGKSTIKEVISPELLGVYINPDDIEKAIRKDGFIDLSLFEISLDETLLKDFLLSSTLLKKAQLTDNIYLIRTQENKLYFENVEINSYYASVIGDFIRRELLKKKISFTFETVMSSSDKLELLELAKQQGYRNYLYYVATKDPEINISRVKNRVKLGGHDVPQEKIIARYYRSLELLLKAIKLSDRAYIFDNSSTVRSWIAEITDGVELELKINQIPSWFFKALNIGNIYNKGRQ